MDCKFSDASCRNCGKVGHLAIVCRQVKNVNFVHDNYNDADNYLYPELNVEADQRVHYIADERVEPIVVNVQVNDVEVPMEIDTGQLCP